MGAMVTRKHRVGQHMWGVELDLDAMVTGKHRVVQHMWGVELDLGAMVTRKHRVVQHVGCGIGPDHKQNRA
jgi:hypothetical protein